MASAWFVYMIRTAEGALYTGITTDVERRFAEHVQGKKGAKSLRGKGPLELVFQVPASDRSEASRLEARIKKLGRREKQALAAGDRTVSDLLTS